MRKEQRKWIMRKRRSPKGLFFFVFAKIASPFMNIYFKEE